MATAVQCADFFKQASNKSNLPNLVLKRKINYANDVVPHTRACPLSSWVHMQKYLIRFCIVNCDHWIILSRLYSFLGGWKEGFQMFWRINGLLKKRPWGLECSRGFVPSWRKMAPHVLPKRNCVFPWCMTTFRPTDRKEWKKKFPFFSHSWITIPDDDLLGGVGRRKERITIWIERRWVRRLTCVTSVWMNQGSRRRYWKPSGAWISHVSFNEYETYGPLICTAFWPPNYYLSIHD